MRVSQLAHRTGVSVHRLRRWESAGLIRSHRTGRGEVREFDESSVRETIFVSMARDMGFDLDTIAALMPRYRAGTVTIDEMVAHLHARLADVEAQLAEQRALRDRLIEHIAWFEDRRPRAHRTEEQP
ncbi:MerR family transcriptional regulator [Nocardia puris]|uniref:DNA-binding transcriptional MerR regulator n=1 Tax=Nocardia puris TaxID=208602 RepID=A0A366D275_9NOCA|nr:MerR family transcriptional regulator [Nocardia puris]MBF6215153.1 MerR family transcriptional regulator [Nocardia puris]MBF6369664.1 MerR family transcriptional regulator [Nocardia puris]MBF6462518.1 MerR family transcriptional regulator [Nocardia puris]RBO83609.1 DNA-binding transcriptional MerR regulator [Nocardia puris]